MNPPPDQKAANPPGRTTTQREELPPEALPRPVIKKMRLPFPLIWIVPILAAGIAAYFLYQHHQEVGTEITIEFPDAAGITEGQTSVQIHGVNVGRVGKVVLSGDHAHAMVHVHLRIEDKFIAREQTIFWVVRPEVSLESITGLGTLITGPYIEAKPGPGAEATSFSGLAMEPKAIGPGLHVLLHAVRLGSVTPQTPITYLGIQVGIVQDVQLSDDAETADVHLFIWERYAPLVRQNSMFWAVKSVDFQGGIFSGIKLKLNNVKSLLTGGISFATEPGRIGAPAQDGTVFFLHDQPKDEWLAWRPCIALPPAPPPESGAGTQGNTLPSPQSGDTKSLMSAHGGG